jgi:hypothetical protein
MVGAAGKGAGARLVQCGGGDRVHAADTLRRVKVGIGMFIRT